jgi:hypothetical protein
MSLILIVYTGFAMHLRRLRLDSHSQNRCTIFEIAQRSAVTRNSLESCQMRNFAIYSKYNLGILKAGQSFIEKTIDCEASFLFLIFP